MLSITYHVIPKSGAEPIACVASGTLFDSHCGIPDWFGDMTPPEHTSPIELWSPIAGDPGHVVYISGLVSYWYLPAADIEPLLSTAAQEEAAQYRELRDRFPDQQYQWLVRSESRTHNRVPKSDPKYQEQLRVTFTDSDGSDD